jgi:hypothetical protein
LALDYDEGVDEIAIHVGAFDEAANLVPTYHYGVEGRLPWTDCGAGLPAKVTSEKPYPTA